MQVPRLVSFASLRRRAWKAELLLPLSTRAAVAGSVLPPPAFSESRQHANTVAENEGAESAAQLQVYDTYVYVLLRPVTSGHVLYVSSNFEHEPITPSDSSPLHGIA